MADEQSTQTQTDAQPTHTEAQSAQNFTADQVAEIAARAATEAVAKAKDSIFAEARRTFQKAEPERPAKKTQAITEQSEATFEETLRWRDAFSDATEGFKFPSAKAKDAARREFVTERPSSGEDWFSGYAAEMGWQLSTSAATTAAASAPAASTINTQAQAVQAKQPSTPVASQQVAPKGTTVGEFPADPFDWSQEELNAYIRANYPYPHTPNDVRNRPARKKLREMAEKYAATRQVQLDRRR